MTRNNSAVPDRLVLHIPHACSVSPEGFRGWSPGIERHINRWTDWYTDWLFCTAAKDDARIIPVIGHFSRFFFDGERLVDDPLETVGQGIVYTRFGACNRIISPKEKDDLFRRYYIPQMDFLCSRITPDSFLIDCHSFPSDLSDTDVCIGVNEDWSHPDEGILRKVIKTFEDAGYRTGLNTPYSNSLAPEMPFTYPSMMIELNKRIYMKDSGELDYYRSLPVIAALGSIYAIVIGNKPDRTANNLPDNGFLAPSGKHEGMMQL